MSRFKKIFHEVTALIALCAALSLSACGNSPLFHHENASPARPSTVGENTPNAEAPRPADESHLGSCPLAFPNHHLCAELTWNESPADDRENSFKLQFWNESDGVVSDLPAGLTVGVQPWMPAMGHGVSMPVKVSHDSTGTYSATNLFFTMPGDWEVRIQIKQGTKVLEQSVIALRL
jgi:hypothetical protein